MGGTPNIKRVAGYSEYNFSLLPKTAAVCACAVHCVVGSDSYLQDSLGLCSTSAIQKIINPLKMKRRLLNLKPSLYRAVNTFHLGYKNQPVYAVSGTSHCLFPDKYKTHKYSVGRAYSC